MRPSATTSFRLGLSLACLISQVASRSLLNNATEVAPPGSESVRFHNNTDAESIDELAESGQCMYYNLTASNSGIHHDASQASCAIYCQEHFPDYAVSWNCTAPDTSGGVAVISDYADEQGARWTQGTCACTTLTNIALVTINSTFFAMPVPEKTVQDLATWGYTFGSTDYQDIEDPQPQWQLRKFELAVPWGAIPVGIFGTARMEPKSGALIVYETHSNNDERVNRASLSDQILSFWKISLQRDLSTLSSILYVTPIEAGLRNIRPQIHSKMGVAVGTDLLVRRTGGTDAESESFHLLLTGTEFGRAALRAIDDYAEFGERTVEGFKFEYSADRGAFVVYFDGVDMV